MSSSLPVPSKAALTALRGIVLGTSCTLALVAEDRRRKINNAVRVIENGEKIKSAKRYRPGGGALALAIEEEAMWDPGLITMPRMGMELHQHQKTRQPPKSTREDELGAGYVAGERIADPFVAGASETESRPNSTIAAPEQDGVSNIRNTGSPAPRLVHPVAIPSLTQNLPKPSIRRAKAGPSWLLATADVVKQYECPTKDEVVARVRKACATRDPRQITQALHAVFERMDQKTSAPGNLDPAWIETTALLCRTCQEEGRLADAAKLLGRIVARGPLEESTYIAHDPFTLIDSLLVHAESGEQTRDVYLGTVETAINLFLPTFTSPPTGRSDQMYATGCRLLEAAFSADRLQRIIGMYRRCNLVAGEDSDVLTSWFLMKMHQKGDHKSVVKVFISTYAKGSPTQQSVVAIGDTIIESVQLAHGYRAEQVLKTLQSVCSTVGTKLSPTWVIRLFMAHWKHHGRYQEIEALFEQLQSPTLQDSVFSSDHIYRIMVELAFEAGEEAKADSYFELAAANNRALASDVRLLGVFARFHAKDGDWEAVRADFEAMQQKGSPPSDLAAYGRVFVPVLKAYAETHTVRETEVFLKSYADELKMPLSVYMVTLMAKQYGAIRDVGSLVDWLDYCSRSGFTVDTAFVNAILVRCRKQWNFPFRDLRTLFRKLRVVNPDSVDHYAERFMADAALTDSKHGGKVATGRLLSLKVDPVKLPSKISSSPQVDDILSTMKESLAAGHPRRAMAIYKRAMHLGMPYSSHALRLAVQARLAADPANYQAAYALIQDAQSRGRDVTHVVNFLLAKQLDALNTHHHANYYPSRNNPSSTSTSTHTTNSTGTTMPTTGDDLAAAYDAIQATLAQYQATGVQLTDVALHRAAFACLRAGHVRAAVAYALRAAEVSPSSSGPCYNLVNFRVLLAAYAEGLDVDGLRDTVRRMLAVGGGGCGYKEEKPVRSALRHARLRINRAGRVGGVDGLWGEALEERKAMARAVVDEGIKAIVEARRKLRAEARVLEEEAVRIMRRAAKDAGREEVDFGEVPWLGGRGRERSGEEGEEVVRDEEGVFGGGECGAGLDPGFGESGRTAAAVEAF